MPTLNPDDPDRRTHVLRRRARQTDQEIAEEQAAELADELAEERKTRQAWKGLAILLAIILGLIGINQCSGDSHYWRAVYRHETQ